MQQKCGPSNFHFLYWKQQSAIIVCLVKWLNHLKQNSKVERLASNSQYLWLDFIEPRLFIIWRLYIYFIVIGYALRRNNSEIMKSASREKSAKTMEWGEKGIYILSTHLSLPADKKFSRSNWLCRCGEKEKKSSHHIRQLPNLWRYLGKEGRFRKQRWSGQVLLCGAGEEGPVGPAGRRRKRCTVPRQLG